MFALSSPSLLPPDAEDTCSMRLLIALLLSVVPLLADSFGPLPPAKKPAPVAVHPRGNARAPKTPQRGAVARALSGTGKARKTRTNAPLPPRLK